MSIVTTMCSNYWESRERNTFRHFRNDQNHCTSNKDRIVEQKMTKNVLYKMDTQLTTRNWQLLLNFFISTLYSKSPNLSSFSSTFLPCALPILFLLTSTIKKECKLKDGAILKRKKVEKNGDFFRLARNYHQR